ncbi:uncharacterized protein LOC127245854 isoform X2 [Andrographis paniculata]|uniref:uncharacterized protein LOC127245854 isoform X2 n=1 Tax=Andrographis paniculata TaxID=175694 RepID=UPI0021E850D2|nr:uncharacterized protein LOC127245854 isoform X2 [Andrographis paniculata]
MASGVPWHPPLPQKTSSSFRPSRTRNPIPLRRPAPISSFRRSDLDGFAKRVASGELWRDAWRRANDGFEQFVYETRKTAERIDRRYAVSTRFSSAAQAAADRAREIDREFEITQRWRTFSLDFGRNWPRYRKQLNDFLETPLGRSFAGQCPACGRQFLGYKNQTIRCANCGNIVWQPRGDFFSRGSTSTSSKSQPDIIDVDFEEK